MRHTGIVIHTFLPKKYKVAIIDNKVGRIDGFISSMVHGQPGSLFTYSIECKGSLYKIKDMCTDDMPLVLARNDILFLHHVFEICYRFIPVGSCVQGIFDLLCVLYDKKMSIMSRQCKKIFLFRLLMLLGMYTTQIKTSVQWMRYVHEIPVDTKVSTLLNLEDEKQLDMWLYYSILEQSEGQMLKTVHFLTENRVP